MINKPITPAVRVFSSVVLDSPWGGTGLQGWCLRMRLFVCAMLPLPPPTVLPLFRRRNAVPFPLLRELPLLATGGLVCARFKSPQFQVAIRMVLSLRREGHQSFSGCQPHPGIIYWSFIFFLSPPFSIFISSFSETCSLTQTGLLPPPSEC